MNTIHSSIKTDTISDTLRRFEKFSSLYSSSKNMGARRILNSKLQLPEDTLTPLSIAHGVDFCHCFHPLDSNLIEPIHWSYNENIHRAASRLKASVQLPHPWLLLCEKSPTKEGKRTLVVSPPPGKKNDERLLIKILEYYNPSDIDILLKYRGDISGSIDFFNRNGIGTVTAGIGDEDFYKRLFSLLSSYQTVVGCSLSSATIFAAAMGKSVEFIKGYSYEYYDVVNILDFINFGSPTARSFALNFIEGSHSDKIGLAQNILGLDFLADHSTLLDRYLYALRSAIYPLHYKQNFHLARRLLMRAGQFFSRPGLVKLGAGTGSFSSSQKRIMRIRVDELSVWKDGPSEVNFSHHVENYIPGITIPATAVSKYD